MRRSGTPDRTHALESYRRLAPGYDEATRLIGRKRLRAIGLLQLVPGDTVLDAACGTGAVLDLLSRAVGPGGRVIGVELSPEMIAQARERVERLGLRNVTLIEAPMEDAAIPGPVDAVLFSYAHDVLRSRRALDRVFAAVRPGARVAAAGAKLYPRALSFLNFWVRWRIRHYVSTLEGLEAPWSLLAEYLPDFAIADVTLFGSGYVGRGTYPGRAA
ncbi:MAG: class I SAM-dependent methyltransferase [Vicinamibacteria bacterium]